MCVCARNGGDFLFYFRVYFIHIEVPSVSIGKMFRYLVTHVLSSSFDRVGRNSVKLVGAGRNTSQLFKFSSTFHKNTMSGQYSVIERGTPNSPNFRVFLSK